MNIILVGSNGAMGKTIVSVVDQIGVDKIVAGIQDHATDSTSFPVFTSFVQLKESEIKADVIIDFSHPSLTESLIDYAVATHTPIMLATTGQISVQEKMIHEASKEIAILDTHNTSIGVNVMTALVSEMTKKLYPLGYDIEIIEKHHRYKKDAPSGTAKMLLKAASDVIDESIIEIDGRSGVGDARQHNEIGMHAVRGGDIVGEHTVLFANNQEVLELTHRAGSKEIFANGALTGARFIVSAQPGIYSMVDALQVN